MQLAIKLKYGLIIAVSLSWLSSLSQDYTFRRYSTMEGLAGQDVHYVMEDSYGFLWVGTGNGLSRFDGKTFKNYGFSEGLKFLTIVTIFEDARHRLWVGTTKGIAELRGDRFFMHQETVPEETRVMGFGEFAEYGLLAFTDKGVYKYNEDAWMKADVLPGYKKTLCQEMVAVKEGLYMTYEDAVIFKRKDSSHIVLLQDTTRGSKTFCNGLVKHNGKVFAGVQNKLYQIENGRLRVVIDSIPVNPFFNFALDEFGNCWVNVSGKGLYKYKLSPGTEKIVSVYEYDSNTAGMPFPDRQGNLWLSNYEGLIKVIPKVFEDITPPRAAGITKRLYVMPGTGKEIIVSDASGLRILEGKRFKQIEKPASYKDENSYRQDIVEGFAKDNRNFTWMMTRQRKMLCWNGVQLLDFSGLLLPRKTDYIRNVTINRVNNTVFLCDDSTLMCGNEEGFGVYTDQRGKSFSKTTTALFTHNGIGVINVFSKGIHFVTRENEIIKAPPDLDFVDKGDYTYFFEDKEGWIWISNAGKGLVHFRIDENDYSVRDLSVLTTEHGLPGNKVSEMAFDADGGKWVSCSNGLVVLKNNPSDSSVWDVYTIGKEQNMNLSAPLSLATDTAGNIWLASIDKLIKVDTRKLILKKVVPQVVIGKVLLDMKETNWLAYSDSVYGYLQLPAHIRLEHSQNTLGLEFAGVSLYNADYFEYSYQLAPLDKSWSSPSSNNFISFVNLPPGQYAFNVRVRGKGTDWSRAASFGFTINPPFWDTWWLRFLLLCLVGALILSFYRARVKKIQKQADVQNQLKDLEMKALKAQMNPHFIYNALNSIQSLIADEKKSEAINYIGTFSRLLRHVLEYTDSNVITLEKELQTLRLYIQLESFRLNMDLAYTVSTDDEIIAENEKVPPLILQPFVENALWHGLSRKEHNKRLSISISQYGNSLMCTVEDNGIGRVSAATYKKQSATELYSSKGIDITVKRLVDFNGTKEAPVTYYDLLDDLGNATGTRAVIHIRRHLS